MLDPDHWNGSTTELHSHAKEGSDPGTDATSEPFQEHIFNHSNWNGSENTLAVHTDIELFRDHFRAVPRTVSSVV